MRERIIVGADGATRYVTIDGDMIDAVAFAYYGNEHKKHTEAILDANPGLAELGAVLPAGLVVVLPRKVEQTTATPFRQLWA